MAKEPKKPEPTVDVEALRAEIRAEEEAKIRAEIVERDKAEAERAAALDAKRSDFTMVTCAVANVHTSRGKITRGQTKSIPADEADFLQGKGMIEKAIDKA